MFKGGLASDAGDLVAYLGSLGAAGAVAVRFLADVWVRDARHPSTLQELSESDRTAMLDWQGWILWIATAFGATIGVVAAAAVLAIESLQR